MLRMFSAGLVLAWESIQCRDEKHQKLKEYSENSPPIDRWPHVFRHEFISLFWLRYNDPLRDTYKKCTWKFIPDGVSRGTLCYCGGQPVQGASMCTICSLDMIKQIQSRAEKGKLLLSVA